MYRVPSLTFIRLICICQWWVSFPFCSSFCITVFIMLSFCNVFLFNTVEITFFLVLLKFCHVFRLHQLFTLNSFGSREFICMNFFLKFYCCTKLYLFWIGNFTGVLEELVKNTIVIHRTENLFDLYALLVFAFFKNVWYFYELFS